MSAPEWTTPVQIAQRVRRLWERGDLLRAELGDSCFPLDLPLKRPNAEELSQRFAEARDWIRSLEEGSKTRRGFGYEIMWTEVRHRLLGENRVPQRIVVSTKDDAFRLIGARRDAERFARAVEAALAEFPSLREWIARKPLALLEHADAWERILRVLAWFRAHPRSGIYLRQLDVPGVDTKFVESRKGLFAELLDVVLPPEAIDTAKTGARSFEQRYGLRSKPSLIRFRLLDENLFVGDFSDLSVPTDEFARANFNADEVFITENDANGLAFPNVSRSIVIFGLGYGVEHLAEATWLSSRRIRYWGDIDTHGFAMLDALRKHFPHVKSLLMDRKTLESHRELWTHEAQPCRATLERLTPEERSLYEDLRDDRLGKGIRLEQERISFGVVRGAIEGVQGMK